MNSHKAMNRAAIPLGALSLLLSIMLAPWRAAAQPLLTYSLEVTHEVPGQAWDKKKGSPYQGRVNAIAVDPISDSHVLVMTDSGGLFESWNSASAFEHTRLPVLFGSDVQFSPIHYEVAIATAHRDFREGTAGIWVSYDRGQTWDHPSGAVPFCRDRAGASAISFAPDSGKIFVATDCGVSIGSADGKTWRTVEISPNGFTSIAALGAGRVVIGGVPGILTSDTDGEQWTAAADAAAVGAMGPPVSTYLQTGTEFSHALAANPLSSSEVYAVGNLGWKMRVSVSHDAGHTWSLLRQLRNLLDDNGKDLGYGGIGFVRAARGGGGVELAVSDRLSAWHLHVSETPWGFAYSGEWQEYNILHNDSRDLAFHHDGRPWLAGSDGGLTATEDGSNFHWLAPPSRGLDALQLYDVDGQQVGGSRFDLYYGTQDNGLHSSILPDIDTTAFGGEGYNFSMERKVASTLDDKITFKDCGPCVTKISDPQFAKVDDWHDPDPDWPDQFEPSLVSHGRYVQGAPPEKGKAGGRLFYSSHMDSSWHKIADIPYELWGRPRVSGAETHPVLYQVIRKGTTGDKAVLVLARIEDLSGPGAAKVTYPTMQGFDGFGVNPTNWRWDEILAVDPNDPAHLIAADVFNQRMKISRDGGFTWQTDSALTALVVHDGAPDGRLRFVYDYGPVYWPLVSTISFCPESSQRILIGTMVGGAYWTGDGGATWKTVPNSKQIQYATSVLWEPDCHAAYVSTYGRGLWKILWVLKDPLIGLELTCPSPCVPWNVDRLKKIRMPGEPDPRWWQLQVEFGRVVDVRRSQGATEVVVSPGSSVLMSAPLPVGVRISEGTVESTWLSGRLPKTLRHFSLCNLFRLKRLRAAPSPPMVVGVIFHDARFAGLALSPRILPLGRTKPGVLRPGPSRLSIRQPYIQALSKQSVGGHAVLSPAEAVIIVARGLRGESALVIDGRVVRRVSPKRTPLQLEVLPPQGFWSLGTHTVELRSTNGGPGIVEDATNFLVPAMDPSPTVVH